MFDTIEASFWDPVASCAWFFRGRNCMKWRAGHGVVPLSGRLVRTLGVDDWLGIHEHFSDGIDAAFWYPSRFAYYFFRDGWYAKYVPGILGLAGVWSPLRQVGVGGWQSLPQDFHVFDSAFYYRAQEHAYFFRGNKYVKYKPGHGVVLLNGNSKRQLGIDGWNGLPFDRVQAVLDHEPNECSYFFLDREYTRWEPNDGVPSRYPRRIGLVHSLDMLGTPSGGAASRGGWPGLSHVVAGPMIARVTSTSAVIWIWLVPPAVPLRLRQNGVWRDYTVRYPVHPELATAVDGVHKGSRIQELVLDGLTPDKAYKVQILLGGLELDTVSFRTAPAPESLGTIRFVVGSCSDMSKYANVRAFKAMAAPEGKAPAFAVLCGDNCYYVHRERTTGKDGPRPRDWESAVRMLLRQLQARNHPDFSRLSRTVPMNATWDDHDFAYNNATGSDLTDDWVGPRTAAQVFRSLWPAPYVNPEGSIWYSFGWGPLEVFLTDTRSCKDRSKHVIWGADQERWLLEALRASTALVKIVVVSTQFLVTRGDSEGHLREAKSERSRLLEALTSSQSTISGRVLFLSGDVHFSELLCHPPNGPARLVELTASPIRRNKDGTPPSPIMTDSFPTGRVFAVEKDGFGLVTVDVTGAEPLQGTIRFEIFAENGQPAGVTAVATWDLATGTIA